MIIYKSWTEFKSLVASKNLYIQYHEEDYKYKIFATESATVEYFCEIWKDTTKVKGLDVTQNNLDKADFENNYKANANQSPYGEGNIFSVIANVPRYRPKIYTSATEITLNSSGETDLYTENFDGKLDLLVFSFDRSNVELVINIDGNEIFRAELLSLTDLYKFNLAEVNTSISVRNNGKQILLSWVESPVDILQSLTIRALPKTDQAVKMKSIVAKYRVKV